LQWLPVEFCLFQQRLGRKHICWGVGKSVVAEEVENQGRVEHFVGHFLQPGCSRSGRDPSGETLGVSKFRRIYQLPLGLILRRWPVTPLLLLQGAQSGPDWPTVTGLPPDFHELP